MANTQSALYFAPLVSLALFLSLSRTLCLTCTCVHTRNAHKHTRNTHTRARMRAHTRNAHAPYFTFSILGGRREDKDRNSEGGRAEDMAAAASEAISPATVATHCDYGVCVCVWGGSSSYLLILIWGATVPRACHDHNHGRFPRGRCGRCSAGCSVSAISGMCRTAINPLSAIVCMIMIRSLKYFFLYEYGRVIRAKEEEEEEEGPLRWLGQISDLADVGSWACA